MRWRRPSVGQCTAMGRMSELRKNYNAANQPPYFVDVLGPDLGSVGGFVILQIVYAVSSSKRRLNSKRPRGGRHTGVGDADSSGSTKEVLGQGGDLGAVADGDRAVVAVGVVGARLLVLLEPLHQGEKILEAPSGSLGGKSKSVNRAPHKNGEKPVP
jgi:hypothetical protein